MATTNHQWHSKRALSAQIGAINRKIDEMQMEAMHVQSMTCDWCGGGHIRTTCQVGNQFMQPPEQVNFVGHFPRQQYSQYPCAFNPGWGGYPNQSWPNQHVPKPFPQNFHHPEQNSNLEELMTKFIANAETRFQNNETTIKNLEKQVEQLAQLISTSIPGTLPGSTEVKEKARAENKVSRLANDLELCIQEGGAAREENEKMQGMATYLNANPHFQGKECLNLDGLDTLPIPINKPSTQEPPSLELKQPPPPLEYAFLEAPSALPVIISVDLSHLQREKLLRVSREHMTALARKVSLMMRLVDVFRPTVSTSLEGRALDQKQALVGRQPNSDF